MLGYQIRDGFALVTCARVDEISLVDNPGNPDAIVKPTPAVVTHYDLMADRVRCLVRHVEVLQQLNPALPETPPERPRSLPPPAKPNFLGLTQNSSRLPVEPNLDWIFWLDVAALERQHPTEDAR